MDQMTATAYTEREGVCVRAWVIAPLLTKRRLLWF